MGSIAQYEAGRMYYVFVFSCVFLVLEPFVCSPKVPLCVCTILVFLVYYLGLFFFFSILVHCFPTKSPLSLSGSQLRNDVCASHDWL